MGSHALQETLRGRAGLYAFGEMTGPKNLQIDRFIPIPGAEPHTPHRHADEEVLIVSKTQG